VTAKAARQITVSVISPERIVFEGGADMVVAPAWDGEIGILRGHAPTLVLLGSGSLRISDGTQTRQFHVAGGFMQVADDVVTILSEQASEG
jgi:F-type H+-transporting ATPase subunit epsilon